MNVSPQQEADWHAVTDRYAEALLRMESGSSDARIDVLEAYRQLQSFAPDPIAARMPPRSSPGRWIRKYTLDALRGARVLLAARYGPMRFLP